MQPSQKIDRKIGRITGVGGAIAAGLCAVAAGLPARATEVPAEVPARAATETIATEAIAVDTITDAISPTEAIPAEATPAIPQAEIPTEIPAEIPEDIPEEILRTEIITEARSPLTGEPLSAAEYAQLQAELAAPPVISSTIPSDLRYLLLLLQLRRAVRPIVPFL